MYSPATDDPCPQCGSWSTECDCTLELEAREQLDALAMSVEQYEQESNERRYKVAMIDYQFRSREYQR